MADLSNVVCVESGILRFGLDEEVVFGLGWSRLLV